MATPVDSQVVVSRAPDGAGTGAFQQELKNQQLNDALAAGTVVRIIMHGDSDQYKTNYDIATIGDLASFIDMTDLIYYLNTMHIFNMGHYNGSTPTLKPRLYLRTNDNPTAQQDISNKPIGNEIIANGEVVVDNYNAALYTLRYTNLAGQSIAPVASKIDAGSVNGYVIPSPGGSDSYVGYNENIDLINSVFSYNSASNALTIKSLAKRP